MKQLIAMEDENQQMAENSNIYTFQNSRIKLENFNPLRYGQRGYSILFDMASLIHQYVMVYLGLFLTHKNYFYALEIIVFDSLSKRLKNKLYYYYCYRWAIHLTE